MKVKGFQGKDLRYQVIEPDDYDAHADYPLVIMLHGYAASMEDIGGLAPYIDRKGYLYACPGGPIEFEVRSGRIGYGWSCPGSPDYDAEEVEAAKLLADFYEEIFERFDAKPGNVLLMGFSQGGSLSLRCGLPRPETFAGLASLSGYLPEPSVLEATLPAHRSQPIFISHGVNDQYIPLTHAQETRDFLEAQGYKPRYREYVMRHEVTRDVINDLVPWVKQVLPPFGA